MFTLVQQLNKKCMRGKAKNNQFTEMVCKTKWKQLYHSHNSFHSSQQCSNVRISKDFHVGNLIKMCQCWLSTKTILSPNEPFSTAERSERVENFLFRATREYTEAGIEQAIVAMRRLGANSPEPRKRAVCEWHVSTQKTGSYKTERSRLPGLIVDPCPSEESLCCPACPPALPCFRRVSAPSL